MRGRAGLSLLAVCLLAGAAIAVVVLLRSGSGNEGEGEPEDPSAPFAASFYERPLRADAAIDPASDAAVAELSNLAFGLAPEAEPECRAVVTGTDPQPAPADAERCAAITFTASIEADDFAPPIYEVDADQRALPVTIPNAESNLDVAMAEDGVPIPDGAEPAPGSDGQLVVYQPSSDTMWELWQADRAPGGSWSAVWGGRIEDVSASPGHFRDVADPSRPDGFSERHDWGETATSLPNMPGVIKADELREGEIDHALNIAILNPAAGTWAYPAQRGDGRCVEGSCSTIPQGARFRLDPGFDTEAIEHPVVRMVAEAAQRYGLVVNNTADAGVVLYTEGPEPFGADPFTGEEDLLATGPAGSTNEYMLGFPWEELQLLELGTSCQDVAVECDQPEGWDEQFDE